MDLETLKTELRSAPSGDVDAARIATLTELERRANLAAIPGQIASLAQTYRDGGGDEQTLAGVLTPGQDVPDGATASHFDYLPEEA